MLGQHTPRKSISGRIFAILGVLVLVGSMAPVPWLVEEGVAIGDDELKVTRSDYRTEVEEIRGLGAFAYVVLEDHQRDPTYDMRGVVEMTASVEDGESVDFILLETGIGTGVFQGGFGFGSLQEAEYPLEYAQFGVANTVAEGKSPKNARLPVDDVDDGETVTVETKGTPTRTTSFEWFETDNATDLLVFDEQSQTVLDCDLENGGCEEPNPLSGHSQINVEIRDGGLKKDSYSNLVRVFSTSDPTGTRVEIEKVGSSNRFLGQLSLVASNPDDDELRVQDGDELFFEYFEPHRTDGTFKVHVHGGLDFNQEAETSISVDQDVYYGVTKEANKHGSDRAVVVIKDNSRENKESALEKPVDFDVVGSVNNPYKAHQLGPRSGVYVATLGFGDEPEDDGIQYIEGLEDGDEVIVEYEGDKETFVWRDIQDAELWFVDEEKKVIVDSMVDPDEVWICVSDSDSKEASSISVSVKTSSDPTNDQTISLSSSIVNCEDADYEGSFAFEQVSVEDGDWVVVEHEDSFTKDGSRQIVRSSFVQWLESSLPVPPSDFDDADEDDDIKIDSIEFRDQDDNEISEADGQRTIQLRVETGDAKKDVLKVSLDTHCGDVPVYLTETNDGSDVFTAPIKFSLGLECGIANDNNAVGYNRIPVPDDLVVGFDIVKSATEIEESDPVGLKWFPAHHAKLTVSESAFGDGFFRADLEDGDLLPYIESQENATLNSDNQYVLEDPYVHGSERVYVEVEETDSFGNGDQEYSVEAKDTAAAEAIAPHLENVFVSCDDVEIEASHAILSPSAECTDVSEEGDIEFTVSNCTAGDCDVTFIYRYRADVVETCSGDEYTYMRDGQTIEICDDPDQENIITSFVHGERTISGIGPNGEETDDEVLTHTGSFTDEGTPIFSGEVSVWFSTASSSQEVVFTYKDPVQDFDGNSGSENPGHFRSTFVNGEWNPSETATLWVMKDDFSGSASGTIYGPGIPVEVQDLDASHPERRDTIAINGAIGENDCSGLLNETSKDSGIFRGVLEVADCKPGDGRDKVQLTYIDAHDSDGDERKIEETINRRPSDDGDVIVCSSSDCPGDGNKISENSLLQGTHDGFYVRVNDTDQTPSSSIEIRVASDSQPIGEKITLSRVGSGPSAYFLSSEVQFETTNNPGNNRLYVEEDNEWWIEYDDSMDGAGKIETFPDDKFEWRPARDGRVAFDRAFHIGTEPGVSSDSGQGLERLARGVVSLTDPDLNKDPYKIDSIKIEDIEDEGGDLIFSIDGDEEGLSGSLVLVETGHNTGVFVGMISFGGGSCVGGFPCIKDMVNEDELKVVYTDPQSASEGHDDDATTKWFKKGRGVVTFDRGGYTIDRDPVITVYDFDLSADEDNLSKVPVSVVSGSDSSGIPVDLGLRDDGNESEPHGIFSGTINLRTSSSSGFNLKVNEENDEIEARYDDSEPPGTRKATALIGVGSEPVTTLVTDPGSPDGDNDWFVSQVTLEFDTNVQVEETRYRRNGGTEQTFSSPITLGEGIHEFEFWSVDLFEGFVEDKKTQTIKVSLNDPTAEIEIDEVSELPDGQIELGWDAVSGKTDPLLFGEYKVYRGDEGAEFADAELVSENVTSESYTDRPPSDNPPQLGETFTYYVRVANEAGRLGPVSDAVDGLSDRVAPRVSSFDVDRNELIEELGEDTVNADLTVEDDEENLDDIDRVFLRVVDPFGNEEAEVNMTGSSTSFSAAYTEFDTCGVYSLFGIASDAIGNEGRLNESVRFVGLDVDAPQLQGMASEIQQGQDLNVTVVDNCAGVASIAYSINDGDRREVNVPSRQLTDNCSIGPCEVAFKIAASRLVPGENRITFELTDANETANLATIRHTVTMVIPDDPEVEDPPVLDAAHAKLVEHGGTFSFSVSGGTPTSIEFEAGDVDLGDVIGGLTRSTGRVRVDISDLESGPQTATVTVTNAFGTDTADLSFYILEEGIPLPPINVQVSKDDNGRPVISWSPNPDSEVEVGGYLVHRAASPWQVIAVTDAETDTYTDTAARGGQSYRYTVTSYGANGEGRLNEGDDSEESLAWFQGVDATTFDTDEIDSGIPPVVFWVILIVLAVVVVVSLLYVNRRQIFGSKAEEIYAEEYPDEAETPFGEERHMIRCPNCSEDFHVSGERPVVTDCPNCGRKGILR